MLTINEEKVKTIIDKNKFYSFMSKLLILSCFYTSWILMELVSELKNMKNKFWLCSILGLGLHDWFLIYNSNMYISPIIDNLLQNNKLWKHINLKREL